MDGSCRIVFKGDEVVIEQGTGRVARIEGVSVAGKTGTAENYGMIYGRREKLKDHSWFVCFAPRENPKIAVAVIVENGAGPLNVEFDPFEANAPEPPLPPPPITNE